MSTTFWSVALISCLLLFLAFWVLLPSFFEEPKYQVIKKSGNFEVRSYPKMLIASLVRRGKRDTALRSAFPYLARYIGGKDREGGAISMTVPVMQFKGSKEDEWNISFVMPKKFSYKNIPKPENSEIKLNEMKGVKVAAVRFSGSWDDIEFKRQETLLRNWLEAEGYVNPLRLIYAFYNDPMTPSIFRRNEILMELE